LIVHCNSLTSWTTRMNKLQRSGESCAEE